MRFEKIIIVLIALVLFSGCMAGPRFDVGLTDVERPDKAEKEYGQAKIERWQEKGQNFYTFSDEMVKVDWSLYPCQIILILTNKTDQTMKVIWSQAAYVDENGRSHKLVHHIKGQKNPHKSQPPSVVVSQGHIVETIAPADHIASAGGWGRAPLIQKPSAGQPKPVPKSEAQSYIGKTIKVLLPLKVKETKYEYMFHFQINGVLPSKDRG